MVASRPKILVVDDQESVFGFLKAILNRNGFDAVHERLPGEAVDTARREKPVAILLDFEMPLVQGPEVCRRLKLEPQTSSIPVIFVTSHVGDAEIREAFFAGADDFISKPPHELELVLRLTRVIRDRELQQKVERQLDDQVRMTRLIAHDINNLLTFTALGIEGMLKVSAPLSPTDSALFERHYKRAALGAERMRELISNVQAVEALEEKGRGLVVSPVELKPLLDECADVFADPLALKDVRLEVVCPPGLAVMAEPLTLSNSVVGNLVSNALKFSFRGGAISLRVREDGDLVELEVRDRGVGMPPDLLERVFLKSEKTSRPGTEQEKGTGFGMPIVKRAMEAFGGSVVIDSVSHQGSDPNGGTRVKLIFRRAN